MDGEARFRGGRKRRRMEDLLFCETGCQLKMDGEERLRGGRKRRRTGGWTRIRRGVSKEEEAS